MVAFVPILFLSPIHFLVVAAALFGIGTLGLVANRSNLIIMLMCIELMLLAVNILFISFSMAFAATGSPLHHGAAMGGQVFSLLILAIAAAEAAIGLAILVIYFRNRSSVATSDKQIMKG